MFGVYFDGILLLRVAELGSYIDSGTLELIDKRLTTGGKVIMSGGLQVVIFLNYLKT